VVVETASSERSRKKVLLDLSEDEDEEEAPPVAVSEALPVTVSTFSLFEEETAEEPDTEEAAAAEAMIEVSATEVVVEEEASAEAMVAEEAVEDISDDETPALGSPLAAKVDVAPVVSAEHSLVTTVPASPLPSAPPRPRGIVFRSPPRSSVPLSTAVMSMPTAPLPQESVVVTALAMVEAVGTDAPSLPPISSAVLTELVAADTLGAMSAAEVSIHFSLSPYALTGRIRNFPFLYQETASPEDLEELFASLYKE
ncbi:unnamed protein product, partial [Prunus brigantina]